MMIASVRRIFGGHRMTERLRTRGCDETTERPSPDPENTFRPMNRSSRPR
jgi:hypothetical protein